MEIFDINESLSKISHRLEHIKNTFFDSASDMSKKTNVGPSTITNIIRSNTSISFVSMVKMLHYIHKNFYKNKFEEWLLFIHWFLTGDKIEGDGKLNSNITKIKDYKDLQKKYDHAISLIQKYEKLIEQQTLIIERIIKD